MERFLLFYCLFYLFLGYEPITESVNATKSYSAIAYSVIQQQCEEKKLYQNCQ